MTSSSGWPTGSPNGTPKTSPDLRKVGTYSGALVHHFRATLKVQEGPPAWGPERGLGPMILHLALAFSLPVIAVAILFTGWFKNLVNASGTM